MRNWSAVLVILWGCLGSQVSLGFVGRRIPCYSFPVLIPSRCGCAAGRRIQGARFTLSLSASQAEESSAEDDTEAAAAIISRRTDLMRQYHFGTLWMGLTSVLLLLMPDKTHTAKLASKVGGAAGYALAAGVSYLLAEATSHGRLQSDTYKRLNVGLLFFSLVGLLAVPGEAAFHPRFVGCVGMLGLATAVKLYGCRLAYTGWRRGMDPEPSTMAPKPMLLEFLEGTKDTLSGLFETTKKGLAYRNYVLLIVLGGFSAFMEGLFCMHYHAPLFPISLQWSAMARLCLLSTMIYSLKDAAERDRLTGTTFIKLNFFVGLWPLAVGIGQGTSSFGFSISRTPMLLFSVPFLLEAGKYQRKKLEKKAKKKEMKDGYST